MDGDIPGSSLFGLAARQPPQNTRAEQALLGAILANNRAADRCTFLRPEHFADPVHARIYAAAIRKIEAGQLADAVTLKAEFEHSGILDEVGGTAYLADLLTAMVGIINAGEYAASIRDAWLRRQLIDIGENTVNLAFGVDPDQDAEAIAVGAAAALDALQGGAGSKLKRLGDGARETIARAEAAFKGEAGQGRLDTGIRSFDAVWGGLWPGQLYYLMARSRTGKTPAACQIARNVAARLLADHEAAQAAEADPRAPKPPPEHVHFISLEMTAEDLATINLASTSRWTSDQIRAGEIGDGKAWNELDQARARLDRLPIVIDDDADMSIATLRSRIRAVKRTHRTRLVIIDYAEIIGRDRETARMPLSEWIPVLGYKLKAISKAVGVPILALRQLNKARDGADSQRPTLGDLPYDGGQAADAVFCLYRPELTMGTTPPARIGMTAEKAAALDEDWHRKAEALRGVAEFGALKRRFGAANIWKTLRFIGPRVLFVEAADDIPAHATETLPDLLDGIE